MPVMRKKPVVWCLGLASLAALVVGCLTQSTAAILAGLGAAGLCCVALGRLRRAAGAPAVQVASASDIAPAAACAPGSAEAADAGSLVDEMLAQGRYALLLRRQLVGNLRGDQLQRAREAWERNMSGVPEGEVLLTPRGDAADDSDADFAPQPQGTLLGVGALFLDRYAVTNRQYQQFVRAGGYGQMAIWDPQIWPAVVDFVDSTGCPGPRFWTRGCYPSGTDEQPVVGISWYEAAAYARWAGKRLPADAEWVKAASWPMPVSSTARWQRKYPWGDSVDRDRCNVWVSGVGGTVAVTEYATGASVGGVYQLIGNVWEWTSGNFGAAGWSGGELALAAGMKSIRGGAFDTYFESQAACQFQSGENPLSRKHNIGFRCALSACDVAAGLPANPTPAAGTAVEHSSPVEGAGK